MRIFLDADAFPNVIKEILFRAVERVRVPLILVANQDQTIPASALMSSITVPMGPDEADDRIVALMEEGDLVLTSDIPLADRVIAKGGYALNPRGELYTIENIKGHLAVRNLMDELRNSGINTGGHSAFSHKDRLAFANQLDRFLTKYCKK